LNLFKEIFSTIVLMLLKFTDLLLDIFVFVLFTLVTLGEGVVSIVVFNLEVLESFKRN
jgi:hypothetical protein